MGTLSVYTTDADPKHLYSSDDVDRSPDLLVNQLARASGRPVDLFVDVRGERVLWNFKGTSDRSTRTNYFVADYQSDDQPGELLTGLRRELNALWMDGGWKFADKSDARWSAGLELPAYEPALPGLSDADRERFVELLEKDWPQVAVGITSFEDALSVVRYLYEHDVDCTVAVNSNGTTPETEHVDLVMWPEGEEKFKPLDESTMNVFSQAGFRDMDGTSVVDETPGQNTIDVGDDDEDDGQPFENAVNIVGRLSLGLLIVLLGLSLAGIASIEPAHQLTGLGALAGLAAAATGRFLVPELDRTSLPDRVESKLDSVLDSVDVGNRSLFAMSEWDWQENVIYFAYFVVLGYLFVTVSKVVSLTVLNLLPSPAARWMYATPRALFPAVVFGVLYYGIVLTVLAAAVLVLLNRRMDLDVERGDLFRLATLHAVLVFWLVFFDGLACLVWFRLLGVGASC
jgi:hypothetical protein